MRNLLLFIFISFVFALKNSSVSLAWIRIYDGPAHGWDEAWDIAVDNFGNVYVTGGSPGDGTFFDYLTIKYDSLGNELWERRWDGEGLTYPTDEAFFISVNSLGEVYVSGSSAGKDTNFHIVTIKYSTDGEELWVKKYEGNSEPDGMVLDPSGNLYIVGTFSPLFFDSIGIIKYSSDGEEMWIRRFHSEPYSEDWAKGIAIDNAGNIIVIGESWCNEITKTDILVLKYSPNGDLLWTRRWNSPNNWWDGISALCVDNNGNIYITGDSYGGIGGDVNLLTIKYSPNGDLLWERTYPNHSGELITIDNSGNIYVISTSLIIKYDPFGEILWERTYSRAAKVKAALTDATNNIYITGYTNPPEIDYFVIKLDPNGNLLWEIFYNGSANGSDWPNGMVIDNNGNIYVTGMGRDTLGSANYTTIKYAQLGTGIEKEKQREVKKEIKIRNLYDITGKLIKENKTKKGIYFRRTEKGIEKIIILK